MDLMTGNALGGLDDLRKLLDGDIVAPDDESWDEARQAWNLAVDQRPAAVALPESAADVVAIVTFARESGLRVAPQGTGHGAGALGELEDTILLKTSRMRGVTVDREARKARVEAGAIWIDVVQAAADHGLAALAGSSPDVGVVGYTLGGGLSWLSRKHGLGANQVTAIEVVTAAGDLVRTDWAEERDLFWALRGGGGAFGVVTAIEFNLFPVEQLYAGLLWFPVERAAEVLKAWRAWTETVPEEMTSVGRILQFPPIPEIPEEVRGKSFVVVQAFWLGDEAEGTRLLEPLRGLGPVLDTVAPTPARELWRVHMDPEEPVPYAGDGQLLDDVARISSKRSSRTPWARRSSRSSSGTSAARSRVPLAPRRSGVVRGVVRDVRGRHGARTGGQGGRRGCVRRRGSDAVEPWAGDRYVPQLLGDPTQGCVALLEREATTALRQIKAMVDPGDVIRSNDPSRPRSRECRVAEWGREEVRCATG